MRPTLTTYGLAFSSGMIMVKAMREASSMQIDEGGKDVFVHISAVERSGMRGLAEGMKISYEVDADRKSGKESATNLKVA